MGRRWSGPPDVVHGGVPVVQRDRARHRVHHHAAGAAYFRVHALDLLVAPRLPVRVREPREPPDAVQALGLPREVAPVLHEEQPER